MYLVDVVSRFDYLDLLAEFICVNLLVDDGLLGTSRNILCSRKFMYTNFANTNCKPLNVPDDVFVSWDYSIKESGHILLYVSMIHPGHSISLAV
jgi:hypothetical protein